MDPTLFYIRHGGTKMTERRLTKWSTKSTNGCFYEDVNPKDFAPFDGTEFDIISRVTLSKEDPESVAPNHKTPTRRQQDEYWAAQPPNAKHVGWSNRPLESDMKQCVLERSTPRKILEHKPNDEKLEDDPEVTKVFDKKLIKRWKSKPIDIVTEFTYMEMMDTGTPLSEAWVSIRTDDLDSVGTNEIILDKIFEEVDDEWSLKETHDESIRTRCG